MRTEKKNVPGWGGGGGGVAQRKLRTRRPISARKLLSEESWRVRVDNQCHFTIVFDVLFSNGGSTVPGRGP